RRGVAVINIGIVLGIERDRTAVIEPDRHARGADALDRAERTVLHSEAALVAQEQHTVAAREPALAAPRTDCHILTQLPRPAHALACESVERLHLVVGVRKDDPARLWRCRPVAIP